MNVREGGLEGLALSRFQRASQGIFQRGNKSSQDDAGAPWRGRIADPSPSTASADGCRLTHQVCQANT